MAVVMMHQVALQHGWSKQTPMHAYKMPGKRYDIGDINSYEYVKSVLEVRMLGESK